MTLNIFPTWQIPSKIHLKSEKIAIKNPESIQGKSLNSRDSILIYHNIYSQSQIIFTKEYRSVYFKISLIFITLAWRLIDWLIDCATDYVVEMMTVNFDWQTDCTNVDQDSLHFYLDSPFVKETDGFFIGTSCFEWGFIKFLESS